MKDQLSRLYRQARIRIKIGDDLTSARLQALRNCADLERAMIRCQSYCFQAQRDDPSRGSGKEATGPHGFQSLPAGLRRRRIKIS